MEHVAVFRLQAADPSINWPERGSAEKALCERDGWERRTIPVVNDGRRTTMEAMCRSELSVNLMLGGEEGFAISLASSGYRLSSGGRVFARCADAMAAAEAMMASCGFWSDVPEFGYSAAQRVIIAITDAAEARGEILLDRVYPR